MQWTTWEIFCNNYIVVPLSPVQFSETYLNLLKIIKIKHPTNHNFFRLTLIARLVGPTWGPSGADRTQVGPMLAPWTLLSGELWCVFCVLIFYLCSTPLQQYVFIWEWAHLQHEFHTEIDLNCCWRFKVMCSNMAHWKILKAHVEIWHFCIKPREKFS